jgi:catechol 2,3-dioxygenase-like lactoylglutathione lyase family enzyme
MRNFLCILSPAALGDSSIAWAQFAPDNELGLSWGHVHLYAADREKETKAWLALGGQLGINLSVQVPITFPGVLILINNSGVFQLTSPTDAVAQATKQAPPRLGSEGSVIDHVAFRVPDLQASVARWRGPNVLGKDATWGLKVAPGDRPGQAFITTPALVKVEILEDKTLKFPIVFDHVHFYVPDSQLKDIQDFYVRMFGAKRVEGQADAVSLPGGKLIFSKSDMQRAPTPGRSLDHIGFNFAGAAELEAFSKRLEAMGAKFMRPYMNTALGSTWVLDGFGAMLDLSKGQRGYFNMKDIEPGYYTTDELGHPRR